MKDFFNKLIKFVAGVFTDENGSPSSKRIAGMICVITLCLTLYHNAFSKNPVQPSTILIECVSMLAFGCLGLASVDKIWGKSRNNNKG
jgi:hypothetical protein